MSYLEEGSEKGASFVAVLVGYGASKALGVNVWLPLLLSLLIGWGIGRIRPKAGRDLRVVLALLAAQAVWMLIGAIVVPAQAPNVALDILISAALLIWALASLARAAAIGIIVFEVLSLGLNLYMAVVIGQWGAEMAALIVHIAIRCGIIAFSVMAIRHGLESASQAADEVEEVFT